jgi:lia operon protein LiaF
MRNGFWGKSIGGLVLIAIGVVFLLNQTGMITVDLGYIFSNFWPIVLIIIGLKGILAVRQVGHGYIGSFIWGSIMIGLGLVFLNNNFGWIPNFSVGDLFKFIIPAILILVGIQMLFRPRTSKIDHEPDPYTPKEWKPYSGGDADAAGPVSGDSSQGTYNAGPPTPPLPPISNHSGESWSGAKQEWKQRNREWKDELRQRKREWKHDWKQWKHDGHHGHDCGHSYGGRADNRHSFIGDVRIGREYWELKPLNISHFVGDTEIDLTRANIPYGETTINISSFVGDVKIFVPNDLQLDISVRASAFLGDMSVFDRWEGGLFRNMKAESPSYAEADKRIRINVSTFIGDVRVKRVG